MFNNIGEKIKGLAWTLFVILIIGSFIAGIALADEVESFGIFLLVSGGGFLLAWLNTLFLYAFGQFVDNTDKMVEQNETIINLLEESKTKAEAEQSSAPTVRPAATATVIPQAPTAPASIPQSYTDITSSSPVEWICKTCGKSNTGSNFCRHCGAKR